MAFPIKTPFHRPTTSTASNTSPALQPVRMHDLTTTVLVNNIHCASCVRHIEETLGQLHPQAEWVTVNLFSGEVHLKHSPMVTASSIYDLLSHEAFEVYGITTKDPSGSLVDQLDFPRAADGWLDGAVDTLRLPQRQSLGSGPLRLCSFPAPTRNKRKRHIEHCGACQAAENPTNEKVSELPDSGNVTGAGNGQSTKTTTIEPPNGQEEKVAEETSGQPEKLPDSSDSTLKVAEKTYKLALSIGGMTCASCTNSVNDALNDLDFVKSVDVDLMTNSASVSFIGTRELEATIVAAIEDRGYEVEISDCVEIPAGPVEETVSAAKPLIRAVLSIGGMTCTSCSNSITLGLQDLPYVKKVEISHMTSSGVVDFEGQQNLDGIIGQVEDMGYDCTFDHFESIQASGIQKDIQKTAMGSRTIQLKVEGMFCEKCPTWISGALNGLAGRPVKIEKEASLKSPVATITYTPSAPDFTIRNLISAIDAANKSFKTTVHHPPTIEARSRQMQINERRRVLKRLVLSFIIAIPTFLIGIVWMSLVPETDSTRMFFMRAIWAGEVSAAQWALFILATPVMFFATDIFHTRAIKEIRALWRKGSKVPIARRFYRFGSMNLLISAGTTVAYVSSLALLIIGATSHNGKASSTTYFDSVVFLTFFILIGRFLEAYSKSKTGDAVAMLGKLRPQEALLIVSAGTSTPNSGSGTEGIVQPTKAKTIDADLLEVGDKVIVPHGSSPPADGIILSGLAQFDESSLTGESRTVKKGPGETVFVGTVNTGSPITIEVSETGGTSMLDQIVSVVREGQTKRAPVERVADILTGYFVPIITALAIMTFFVWLALGQSGFLPARYLNDQAGGWAFWSLEFAIAVFVVACPCGIGLAAPTALFVGGGLAAKHGILVRGGGEAFQEAGDLDIIVFDKTGTLTEGGDLKVTDHKMLAADEEVIKAAWTITKSLEEQSSHPIAKSIMAFASSQPMASLETESITEEPGFGVRGFFTASVEGQITRYEAALGSERFMASLTPTSPLQSTEVSQDLVKWKSESKSVAILALRCSTSSSPTWDYATIFATSDPIRPSAAPTVAALRKRGISVYMLSGDNPITANAVAATLGIPASNVFAGVLPTQKAAKIEMLQAEGPQRVSGSNLLRRKPSSSPRRTAKVAFVGDGINDAPALLASTVSISLASGSPIALTSSSFVLLGPSLLAIPTLLNLSARVFRRIKINFAWALAYNLILVPVAAGVLFKVSPEGFRLGPVWASAAMAGSSVSVVLSSLALRWEGW